MRLRQFLAALLAFLLASPSLLAREASAQAEIEALLSYVEKSNCRFIRGGSEYPPSEAVAHLRMKLDKAGDRVKTAEDFITHIASTSSLSGKPYQIKLPDGTTQPAGPWLTQALAAQRKAATGK